MCPFWYRAYTNDPRTWKLLKKPLKTPSSLIPSKADDLCPELRISPGTKAASTLTLDLSASRNLRYKYLSHWELKDMNMLCSYKTLNMSLVLMKQGTIASLEFSCSKVSGDPPFLVYWGKNTFPEASDISSQWLPSLHWAFLRGHG